MIRILLYEIGTLLCFIKYFNLRKHMSKVKLCLLAGFIVPISAYPSFYEMGEEILDLESKYDSTIYKVPLTTEVAVPDEWKLRGTSRVKCIDETHISPQKVLDLQSGKGWLHDDRDVQKWVLCVLVKMDLMSEEGVYKMDIAMSKINSKDKEFAEALIDNCLPKSAMKPHQIAWHYVKCHNRAKGNFTAISVF